MGRSKAGTELQRPLVMRHRFAEPCQFRKERAEIHVHLGVTGRQRDCPLVTRQSGLQSALLDAALA